MSSLMMMICRLGPRQLDGLAADARAFPLAPVGVTHSDPPYPLEECGAKPFAAPGCGRHVPQDIRSGQRRPARRALLEECVDALVVIGGGLGLGHGTVRGQPALAVELSGGGMDRA